MTFDSIIDFVEALTLIKVFIACCISLVSLMALYLASNSHRIQNHPLTAGMPVMVGLIANAAFTGITLLISVSWGAIGILQLIGVGHPGEWIAVLAILVVVIGFASASDHVAL